MSIMIIEQSKEKKEEKMVKTYGKIHEMEIQKIKELLDLKDLKYVSDNMKELLNLEIENDKRYLEETIRKKEEKIRVILYIRLSIEDGDVVEGDVSKSIKNQLLILVDECKKRQWTIVGIFCEEGISGIDDSRPEWKKALTFCKLGNTEVFLCKSQSRFSRNMEMIEKYLHNKFVDWNIRFVGLVDSTDTSIIGNKKARQINGLVNEWQVEDQSINIRAVLKNKQANGLFTGAFAPYGYQKDPKDKYHLVIDEEAAKIVRRIFKKYVSGMGATKICYELNEKQIPIPSVYKKQIGLKYHCSSISYYKKIHYQVEEKDTLMSIADKHQSTIEDIIRCNRIKENQIIKGQIIEIPIRNVWKANTIYQILKNEVYIGTLVQHKNERVSYKNRKERRVPIEEWIKVPHCHTPIIEKEIWDKVNKKMQRKEKLKANSEGRISIFSGKIRCLGCGHSFYRNKKKTKVKQYIYWVCGNRYRTACLLCNNQKTVKEEVVEQLILQEINKQIECYYDAELIKKEYEKNRHKVCIEDEKIRRRKEKEKLEQEIEEKEQIITLAYEDKAKGIISELEFLRIKEKNNIEIRNDKVEIEKMKEVLEKLEKKEVTNEIDTKIENYKTIKILTREIINEFIKSIGIGYYDEKTNTRRIKIEWEE